MNLKSSYEVSTNILWERTKQIRNQEEKQEKYHQSSPNMELTGEEEIGPPGNTWRRDVKTELKEMGSVPGMK